MLCLYATTCLPISTDYINMSSELQKRRTSCKGWVTCVSNSLKDYIDKEPVLDKVKLSQKLTDLDKHLVSLDMVQGGFELTFEDDTALLAEIDTPGTYRISVTDIRVQPILTHHQRNQRPPSVPCVTSHTVQIDVTGWFSVLALSDGMKL